MRRLSCMILSLLGLNCSPGLYAQEPEPASAIVSRLVDDGYENVRATRNGHIIQVVLEDNHYRGIFRGLAHALQLISPSGENRDSIQLIVLDNRIPRLTINASHVEDSWILDAHYGAVIPRSLRNRKVQNSSAGKLDIIPYPVLSFSNHRYDRLWSSALYLSPTFEMGLWPGAKVVAQLKVLMYNAYVDEHFNAVEPGYITLTQFLKPSNNCDITLSAGMFSLNRTGLDARLDYHVSNSLDLGFIVGATGPWYVTDHNSLRLCYWDKFNAIARINYYHPASNLQFDLKAGRFMYEDIGVRLDLLRHFRDYAVGIYGNHTTYNTNLGIEFSIPLGPRKMGKHRAVRVRLPESISFSFNENIDVYKAYNPDMMEQIYKTAPDQNYSANYWQPELIKDCIQLILDGEIE